MIVHTAKVPQAAISSTPLVSEEARRKSTRDTNKVLEAIKHLGSVVDDAYTIESKPITLPQKVEENRRHSKTDSEHLTAAKNLIEEVIAEIRLS